MATKPRFTDTHKFPRRYMRAIETDITVAWREARKRLEADKAERAEKVHELKQLKGGGK